MALDIVVCAVYQVEQVLASRHFDEMLAVLPRSECPDTGWLAWPRAMIARTVVEVSDIGYGGLVEEAELEAIAADIPGIRLPTMVHADQILACGQAALRHAEGRDWTLLVHCQSGISRSTAAALLILALEDGPGNERQSFRRLCALTGGAATPNHNLVKLGDTQLRRGGRLYAAIA